MSTERPWETVIRAKPLSGSERIGDTGATILDYWRWADSDLLSNTARGIFAEFLVAKAIGDTTPVRDGWAIHDLTMPASGDHGPIKVEVKSGGYLQSWKQSGFSKITFGRFRSWGWSQQSGKLDIPPDYHADAYVFAVHTCKNPGKLDLLDLSQWEFRVLSSKVLKGLGVKLMSWDKVRNLAPTSLTWADLPGGIRTAHAAH